MNKATITKYGVFLGASLILWTFINQHSQINSFPAIIMTAVFFLIFGATIITFLRFSNDNHPLPNLVNLLFIGFVGIGIFCLSMYFHARVIDQNYIEKEIETSYAKWDDLGYTSDEISEQVELTETFREPLYWSFELFKFNMIVFIIILSVLLTILFLLTVDKTNGKELEYDGKLITLRQSQESAGFNRVGC